VFYSFLMALYQDVTMPQRWLAKIKSFGIVLANFFDHVDHVVYMKIQKSGDSNSTCSAPHWTCFLLHINPIVLSSYSRDGEPAVRGPNAASINIC